MKNARDTKMFKWLKRTDWLLGICVLCVIIAIYFSEKIAEHRMQAIVFFVGTALVLWGINIFAEGKFEYPYRTSKEKNVIKKYGKNAKTIGIVIAITGILLTVWGALFWFDFIRNI